MLQRGRHGQRRVGLVSSKGSKQRNVHLRVTSLLPAFAVEATRRARNGKRGETYEMSNEMDLSVSSYSNKNFSTSIALESEQ